jgi:CubicO group peptidase (beta-lactamase class C family)
MALNIVAWHDRTTANHKEMVDKWAAQGFRTLSLCIYGDRNDPRYAAVMIKRPTVIATKQFFNQTAAQFQQTFNEMSAQGWAPYIVSATGPANDPLIASSFRMMKPTPLTRFGITEAEMRQLNQQAYETGSILQSADAYGTPNDIRYIAVWYPNTNQTAWNCDALNDNLATIQNRFDAVKSQGGRPELIAITPAQGYLELFVDTQVGGWVSRANLTSAQYQAEFEKWMAQGLAPVRVAAQGSGSNTRFAAIFAAQEDLISRTFRTTGSTSIAAIDQVMEKFMKAHRIRGASLAIVDESRLVYAKGYTWSEPDYPAVQPTTLYRQASVSKIFVAMAIYQLIQENKLTLDTTLQSVLNLKTPSGGAPVDPKFGQITIRHMLESTCALNGGVMWTDIETTTAFKTVLPVSPMQLASFCATLKLEGTPGDPKNVVYSNTGYFLLSQVVAKLRNASSFEAAIQSTLLKPLNLQRVRQSISLVNQQQADEARYHLTQYDPKNGLVPLVVGASLRSPDRPLVAQQYGAWSMENFDGSGGLSSSVVDVARLVASLSLRKGNPILSEQMLVTWLNNTVKATQTLTGPAKHGFHGFDGMVAPDAKNHVYQGGKGGWLPSHQSGASFTTGGLSYIIAINGNTKPGVTVEWEPEVRAIAEKQNWGTTDLFPQYGMPTFTSPAPLPSPVRGILPTQEVETAIEMQRSSARQFVVEKLG